MSDMPDRIWAANCIDQAGWSPFNHLIGGVEYVRADVMTAALDRAEAEKAALGTLLARNLVFDHGSAEEAVEALGGWHDMTALVDQHRAQGGEG